MAKPGKANRAFSAEEKLRVLEEARQPNTSVSEVLRRHQLDPQTFYRWEKQAREGMRQALSGPGRRNGSARDPEVERLRAELDRKRRIIAEVVEENLQLKKGL
jgi:transposase